MFKSQSLYKIMYLSFFTLLLLSIGCQKSDIQIAEGIDPADSLFETSEYYIDGEHFIDGVSQKEVVNDFTIDGVKVVGGVLAFENQDAFMQAREILAKENQESILAWHEKIGFESLFSETLRLESLTQEQAALEISTGINRHLYRMDDQLGIVELKMHTPLNSLMLNKNGILKIKDHIGTIGHGITIWTKPENNDALVNAIKSLEIKDRSKFIIFDDRGFKRSSKDFPIQNYTDCFEVAAASQSTGLFTAPGGKRHIRISWAYETIISPVSNGLVDYNCVAVLNTTSYRGRRGTNRYKTNHYMSLDLDVVPTPAIGQGWVSNRSNIDQDDNTKTGDIVNHIEEFRNVTSDFAVDNFVLLVEFNPGALNSGQTGTSGFHRGMAGQNLRVACAN